MLIPDRKQYPIYGTRLLGNGCIKKIEAKEGCE